MAMSKNNSCLAITVIFLFCHTLISAEERPKPLLNIQLRTNGTNVSIKGVIFLESGSRVELTCVSHNSDYHSSDIIVSYCRQEEYPRKCSPLSLQDIVYIDNSTAKIVIENITIADSGTYSCCYKNCSTAGIYDLKTVNFGTLPDKPTGVTCISDNLRSMTCTVELAADLNTYGILTKVGIEYTVDGINWINCPEWISESTCNWPAFKDKITYHDFERLSEYKIIAVVRNNLGKSDGYNFTAEPFKIIRPGPVRQLKATTINSTCLNISCQRPDIYSPPINLTYRLEGSSKWEGFKKTFHNETEEYPNFVQCSLIPHTTYNLTISSIPEASQSDIYWGPTNKIIKTTQADVPGASPVLSTDSYSEITCTTGQVYYIIYWQKTPAIQENGPGFNYAINISMTANGSLDGELYQPNVSSFCGIMSLKKNRSINSSLKLKNTVLILPKSADPDVEYILKMNAVNDMGSSINQTELKFIPPRASNPKPRNVIAEFDASNGSYLITFLISNNSSNILFDVTYFWCQGQKIQNEFVDCKNLYWMVMHNGSRSLWIQPVTTTDPGDEWYFAVSLRWQGGSSGMVWQTCSFPHYQKENYKDQKTDGLILVPGPDPHMSFTVILSFDYCHQQNRPMFYKISYKEQDVINSTDITVEAEYGLDKILVSDLEPDREYMINVSVVSKWGPLITKQFHYWTSSITDDENWILVTVIVTLGVMMLLFMPCFFRLCWKKIKSSEIKFSMPNLTSSEYYVSVGFHNSDDISTVACVKNQQLFAIQEVTEDQGESGSHRDSRTGNSLENSNASNASTDWSRHPSVSQLDCRVSLSINGKAVVAEDIGTQDNMPEGCHGTQTYVTVNHRQPSSKYLLSSNHADGSMESYVTTTTPISSESLESNTHNETNNIDAASVTTYSKITNQIIPPKENSSSTQGKETDISLANNCHPNVVRDVNADYFITSTGYLRHRETNSDGDLIGNEEKPSSENLALLGDSKSDSTESDGADKMMLHNLDAYFRCSDLTN